MAARLIAVIVYIVIALGVTRRFIGHLAWQPDDDSMEVAEKPDWEFGIKWGIIGGIGWLPIFIAWVLCTQVPWSAWPWKGRFEIAADKRANEIAHQGRLKDVGMPP